MRRSKVSRIAAACFPRAQAAGVTLAASDRSRKFSIYAHPERPERIEEP
ncbi:MAG: hypothetical protein HYR98_05110 [Nitrospirae bacterium]|nr:hypothetical protein [Nitrospirota bacterium]MBI3392512.1 hypothetical protein [Nitrospirota bacterium]